MQITEEVREYARRAGIRGQDQEILRRGMQEKATEFRARGQEIYVEQD